MNQRVPHTHTHTERCHRWQVKLSEVWKNSQDPTDGIKRTETSRKHETPSQKTHTRKQRRSARLMAHRNPHTCTRCKWCPKCSKKTRQNNPRRRCVSLLLLRFRWDASQVDAFYNLERASKDVHHSSLHSLIYQSIWDPSVLTDLMDLLVRV